LKLNELKELADLRGVEGGSTSEPRASFSAALNELLDHRVPQQSHLSIEARMLALWTGFAGLRQISCGRLKTSSVASRPRFAIDPTLRMRPCGKTELRRAVREARGRAPLRRRPRRHLRGCVWAVAGPPVSGRHPTGRLDQIFVHFSQIRRSERDSGLLALASPKATTRL